MIGYVYILEPCGSHMFKIGMCKDVDHTLKRYRTHCGYFVLHVFRSDTPRLDESFLHNRMRLHHTVAEFFSRGEDNGCVLRCALELAVARLGPAIMVHEEQLRVPRVLARGPECNPEEAWYQTVREMAATDAASEGEPDGKTRVITQLLAGAAVTGDAYDEAYRRVLGNEATTEDKWAHHAKMYKAAWGLDVMDEAFLRQHDVYPTNPKAALLIRVLYPALCNEASLESAVNERETILKTSLIREILEALGVASPFDTEHVVPNLMELWESRLKDTQFFTHYKESAHLFCLRAKTQEWTPSAVVKALGVPLRGVGLELLKHRKTARVAGKQTDLPPSYSLDPAASAEMLELLRLRLRGSNYRGATPNAHARELLLMDEYPKYGRLVDLERKGRAAFAFLDA
jgi:hypothetical protein